MFILSLEDHPTLGFVVQYKEEGISNPIIQLYDSKRFHLAVREYRSARNRIDHLCFKLVEEREHQNNLYCKFQPIFEYVDVRGLGEIR